MHADISRDTFDPAGGILRVIQEQGALLTDAAANEQTAILLYRMQMLALDLFGPFWGPVGKGLDGKPLCGFEIKWDNTTKNYTIGTGRYHVGGRLCESNATTGQDGKPALYTLANQPTYPWTLADDVKTFVVYLDVWEREITEAELLAAGRPVPDPTSPRTRLTWQVKTAPVAVAALVALKTSLQAPDPYVALKALCDQVGVSFKPRTRPTLQAKLEGTGTTVYQSYRVEIHRGGNFSTGEPTFKWARDNGSVVFPLEADYGKVDVASKMIVVKLAHGFLDDRTSLKKGQWVEYIDRGTEFDPDAAAMTRLFYVEEVDDKVVTLATSSTTPIVLPVLSADADRWPMLRRWDFKPDATANDGLPLTGDWLDLENGIQIMFATGDYRAGDYWLIPVRAADGLRWPDSGVPAREVEHHLAPLATVDRTGSLVVTDFRRAIPSPTFTPPPPSP